MGTVKKNKIISYLRLLDGMDAVSISGESPFEQLELDFNDETNKQKGIKDENNG